MVYTLRALSYPEAEPVMKQVHDESDETSTTSCTHVKTHSLFLPVDKFEHGWAGHLEHVKVVGTIMINQQPCSYMIEHVVRE